MNLALHPADQRWYTDLWRLKSYHSFSFWQYYDPENTGFGALKVLNDDRVEAWRWFGAHPHDNMEIISIPLSWMLRHQDSAWGWGDLWPDEVQVMSAWSGVVHSEMNWSETDPVTFFQIWIDTKSRNITPRHDQRLFDPVRKENTRQLLVSPDQEAWSLMINQNAWISRSLLWAGKTLRYIPRWIDTWLYLLCIEGSVTVADQQLNSRDALSCSKCEHIEINALESSEILLIEVPL